MVLALSRALAKQCYKGMVIQSDSCFMNDEDTTVSTFPKNLLPSAIYIDLKGCLPDKESRSLVVFKGRFIWTLKPASDFGPVTGVRRP
jgi:hypothetical protein